MLVSCKKVLEKLEKLVSTRKIKEFKQIVKKDPSLEILAAKRVSIDRKREVLEKKIEELNKKKEQLPIKEAEEKMKIEQ